MNIDQIAVLIFDIIGIVLFLIAVKMRYDVDNEKYLEKKEENEKRDKRKNRNNKSN